MGHECVRIGSWTKSNLEIILLSLSRQCYILLKVYVFILCWRQSFYWKLPHFSRFPANLQQITSFLHLNWPFLFFDLMIYIIDKNFVMNPFAITAFCQTYREKTEVAARRCCIKKLFLKILQNYTCGGIVFFHKVADVRPTTLLKNRLRHGKCPVNFAKFFYRKPPVTVSENM